MKSLITHFLLQKTGARITFFTLVILSLFAGLESVYAQSLVIQGPVQTLTISTAPPGGQPLPAQTTANRLRITRQGVITKVTVATSCPGQKFTLKALATAPDAGTPAPEATLVHAAPAVDFLRNIPTGGGFIRTDILYTASATYAQGTGSDVHTVTYTLVAQ